MNDTALKAMRLAAASLDAIEARRHELTAQIKALEKDRAEVDQRLLVAREAVIALRSLERPQLLAAQAAEAAARRALEEAQRTHTMASLGDDAALLAEAALELEAATQLHADALARLKAETGAFPGASATPAHQPAEARPVR